MKTRTQTFAQLRAALAAVLAGKTGKPLTADAAFRSLQPFVRLPVEYAFPAGHAPIWLSLAEMVADKTCKARADLQSAVDVQILGLAPEPKLSDFVNDARARFGNLGELVAKAAKDVWPQRSEEFSAYAKKDFFTSGNLAVCRPTAIMPGHKLCAMPVDTAASVRFSWGFSWRDAEARGVLSLASTWGCSSVRFVDNGGFSFASPEIGRAQFGNVPDGARTIDIALCAVSALLACDGGRGGFELTSSDVCVARVGDSARLIFKPADDGTPSWYSRLTDALPEPEAPPVDREVTLYCPPRTMDAMTVNGPLTPDRDALPPENRCEWKTRAVYFTEGETDHSANNGNLLVFETDNDAPLASATWAWYASECGMSFDQIRAEVYGDARHGVPEAEAAPQPQPETVRFDIRYGSDRIATVDVPAVPTPVPQPAPVAVHGTGRANKAPSTTKAVARRERALDWVCQQAERSGRFSGRMPPRWWCKVGVLPTERLGFVFESDGQRVIVTRRIDNVAA